MLMMYPVVTSDVFYGGCMMPFPEPDSETMDEDFPLWRYCPRYETVLEPGDVLFNPSWWWHRIMNESSPTIGCATRWVIIPNLSTNTLFDFYHQWCSYFFCNALTLIGKRAFRQPTLTDETTLTVAQRRARAHLVQELHAQKRPSLQRKATAETSTTKHEEEVPVEM
jgi:ribosomal protein L16 Arg81 hydroxylase